MIRSEKTLPNTTILVEVADGREDYIDGWLALREQWRSTIKINEAKYVDPEETFLRAVRRRDICS